MRRTRLEEAWACWLPGSAGGPRLNMPSFSAFGVCCVVSHGRHVSRPGPLWRPRGPHSTLTAWQLAMQLAARVESALEGVGRGSR